MSETAETPAAAAAEARRLVYADLPSVLSIERRSFGTPWSLAMFVLELSKPSGVCLAASRGDELVGYLVCSRYTELWHLMNIAVDPGLRREGVASVLVRELLEQIGGGERVMLEVRESNLGAIEMYRGFGFEPTGRRRRYYQDNGEHAVVMERST